MDAVKLLLKYKANYDFATEQGVTPLMAAAGMGHGANPTRGRFKTDAQAAECARLLIEAGANINEAQDRTRQTALHAAAQHGWGDTVKVLADKGADLEFADSRGLRPYDYASGRSERGYLEPDAGPQRDTMILLRTLITSKTGHAPQEYKGAPLGQTGRPADRGGRETPPDQASAASGGTAR